jgi:uncharacterized membrane protein
MAYRKTRRTDEQGRPVDEDDDSDDAPDSAATEILREKYGGTDDGDDQGDDDSAAEGVLRDRYGRFASQGE